MSITYMQATDALSWAFFFIAPGALYGTYLLIGRIRTVVNARNTEQAQQKELFNQFLAERGITTKKSTRVFRAGMKGATK